MPGEKEERNQKFLLIEIEKLLFGMQSIQARFSFFFFILATCTGASQSHFHNLDRIYHELLDPKFLPSASVSRNYIPNTENQNELLKSFPILAAKTLPETCESQPVI